MHSVKLLIFKPVTAFCKAQASIITKKRKSSPQREKSYSMAAFAKKEATSNKIFITYNYRKFWHIVLTVIHSKQNKIENYYWEGLEKCSFT